MLHDMTEEILNLLNVRSFLKLWYIPIEDYSKHIEFRIIIKQTLMWPKQRSKKRTSLASQKPPACPLFSLEVSPPRDQTASPVSPALQRILYRWDPREAPVTLETNWICRIQCPFEGITKILKRPSSEEVLLSRTLKQC